MESFNIVFLCVTRRNIDYSVLYFDDMNTYNTYNGLIQYCFHHSKDGRYGGC